MIPRPPSSPAGTADILQFIPRIARRIGIGEFTNTVPLDMTVTEGENRTAVVTDRGHITNCSRTEKTIVGSTVVVVAVGFLIEEDCSGRLGELCKRNAADRAIDRVGIALIGRVDLGRCRPPCF